MSRLLVIRTAIKLALSLAAVTGYGAPATLLDRPIKSFGAQDAWVVHLISRLAVLSDVPFGIEVTRGHLEKKFTINIDSGTVRDALTALVALDPSYQWKELDGCVDVYPKVEPDSPFDVVIKEFTASDITGYGIVTKLLKVPEVSSYFSARNLTGFAAFAGSVGSLAPRIFVSVHDQTLRSVLNNIVIAAKGKVWVGTYQDKNGEHFLRIQIS